jgi:hypothetical protein
VQSVCPESEWRQEFVSGDRDSTKSVADNVLKRFNRDTRLVVAGVFGVLLLTVWAFVVLVPERHGLSWRAGQAKSRSSLPEDDATLFRSTHVSTNGSSSAVTSATLLQGDQGSTASSSKENPGRTEAAGTSIPSPAASSAPESNYASAVVNRSDWAPSHRVDTRKVVREKASYQNPGSTGRPGYAWVKKRLLELWHRSLVKTPTQAVFARRLFQAGYLLPASAISLSKKGRHIPIQ